MDRHQSKHYDHHSSKHSSHYSNSTPRHSDRYHARSPASSHSSSKNSDRGSLYSEKPFTNGRGEHRTPTYRDKEERHSRDRSLSSEKKHGSHRSKVGSYAEINYKITDERFHGEKTTIDNCIGQRSSSAEKYSKQEKSKNMTKDVIYRSKDDTMSVTGNGIARVKTPERRKSFDSRTDDLNRQKLLLLQYQQSNALLAQNINALYMLNQQVSPGTLNNPLNSPNVPGQASKQQQQQRFFQQQNQAVSQLDFSKPTVGSANDAGTKFKNQNISLNQDNPDLTANQPNIQNIPTTQLHTHNYVSQQLKTQNYLSNGANTVVIQNPIQNNSQIRSASNINSLVRPKNLGDKVIKKSLSQTANRIIQETSTHEKNLKYRNLINQETISALQKDMSSKKTDQPYKSSSSPIRARTVSTASPNTTVRTFRLVDGKIMPVYTPKNNPSMNKALQKVTTRTSIAAPKQVQSPDLVGANLKTLKLSQPLYKPTENTVNNRVNSPIILTSHNISTTASNSDKPLAKSSSPLPTKTLKLSLSEYQKRRKSGLENSSVRQFTSIASVGSSNKQSSKCASTVYVINKNAVLGEQESTKLATSTTKQLPAHQVVKSKLGTQETVKHDDLQVQSIRIVNEHANGRLHQGGLEKRMVNSTSTKKTEDMEHQYQQFLKSIGVKSEIFADSKPVNILITQEKLDEFKEKCKVRSQMNGSFIPVTKQVSSIGINATKERKFPGAQQTKIVQVTKNSIENCQSQKAEKKHSNEKEENALTSTQKTTFPTNKNMEETKSVSSGRLNESKNTKSIIKVFPRSEKASAETVSPFKKNNGKTVDSITNDDLFKFQGDEQNGTKQKKKTSLDNSKQSVDEVKSKTTKASLSPENVENTAVTDDNIENVTDGVQSKSDIFSTVTTGKRQHKATLKKKAFLEELKSQKSRRNKLKKKSKVNNNNSKEATKTDHDDTNKSASEHEKKKAGKKETTLSKDKKKVKQGSASSAKENVNSTKIRKNSTSKSDQTAFPTPKQVEVGKSVVKPTEITFNTMVKTVINSPVVQKKFKCKICASEFWKEQELSKHSLIHKMRTYDCYKCVEKFTTMRALTKHLLVHEERGVVSTDRPHDCERCGEKFETENQLLVHLRIHEKNETEHACVFCSVKYQHLSELYNHISKSHPEGMQQVLRCSHCNTCFKKLGDFRNHLMTNHKMNGREASLACRNKGIIPDDYKQAEDERLRFMQAKKRAKGLLLRSGITVKVNKDGEKRNTARDKKTSIPKNSASGLIKAKAVLQKSRRVKRYLKQEELIRASSRIRTQQKENGNQVAKHNIIKEKELQSVEEDTSKEDVNAHKKVDSVVIKPEKKVQKIKSSEDKKFVSSEEQNIKPDLDKKTDFSKKEVSAKEDRKITMLPPSILERIYNRVQRKKKNRKKIENKKQLDSAKKIPTTTMEATEGANKVPSATMEATERGKHITMKKSTLIEDFNQLRNEEQEKLAKLQFESAERTARMLIRNQKRSTDEDSIFKKAKRRRSSAEKLINDAENKLEPLKLKVHIKMSDFVTQTTASLITTPAKETQDDQAVQKSNKKRGKGGKKRPVIKKPKDPNAKVVRKRSKYYIYEDELRALRKEPNILNESLDSGVGSLSSALDNLPSPEIDSDLEPNTCISGIDYDKEYDYDKQSEEVFLTEDDLLSSLLTLSDDAVDDELKNKMAEAVERGITRDVQLTLDHIVDTIAVNSAMETSKESPPAFETFTGFFRISNDEKSPVSKSMLKKDGIDFSCVQSTYECYTPSPTLDHDYFGLFLCNIATQKNNSGEILTSSCISNENKESLSGNYTHCSSETDKLVANENMALFSQISNATQIETDEYIHKEAREVLTCLLKSIPGVKDDEDKLEHSEASSIILVKSNTRNDVDTPEIKFPSATTLLTTETRGDIISASTMVTGSKNVLDIMIRREEISPGSDGSNISDIDVPTRTLDIKENQDVIQMQSLCPTKHPNQVKLSDGVKQYSTDDGNCPTVTNILEITNVSSITDIPEVNYLPEVNNFTNGMEHDINEIMTSLCFQVAELCSNDGVAIDNHTVDNTRNRPIADAPLTRAMSIASEHAVYNTQDDYHVDFKSTCQSSIESDSRNKICEESVNKIATNFESNIIHYKSNSPDLHTNLKECTTNGLVDDLQCDVTKYERKNQNELQLDQGAKNTADEPTKEYDACHIVSIKDNFAPDVLYAVRKICDRVNFLIENDVNLEVVKTVEDVCLDVEKRIMNEEIDGTSESMSLKQHSNEVESIDQNLETSADDISVSLDQCSAAKICKSKCSSSDKDGTERTTASVPELSTDMFKRRRIDGEVTPPFSYYPNKKSNKDGLASKAFETLDSFYLNNFKIKTEPEDVEVELELCAENEIPIALVSEINNNLILDKKRTLNEVWPKIYSCDKYLQTDQSTVRNDPVYTRNGEINVLLVESDVKSNESNVRLDNSTPQSDKSNVQPDEAVCPDIFNNIPSSETDRSTVTQILPTINTRNDKVATPDKFCSDSNREPSSKSTIVCKQLEDSNRISTKHASKTFCVGCEKSFSSHAHLELHRKNNSHSRKCNFCQEMFTRHALYKNHLLRHHDVTELFSCKKCKQIFHSRDHKASHTCVKTFKCFTCNEKFSNCKALSRHRLFRHSNNNGIHRCPICARTFLRPSYLAAHKRSHDGLLPFRCLNCGETFRQKRQLYSHKKNIHISD